MSLFQRKARSWRRGAQQETHRGWFAVAILGLIVLLIGLFVLLLYKPFFRIQSIRVVGTESLHPVDIGIETQNMLRKKYAFVVPRATWLTYPQQSLEDHLLATFPRIKEVRLQVKKFETLEIEVLEWSPEYLWCGYIDAYEEQNRAQIIPTSHDCLYVDRTGIVFSEAPTFSTGVYTMLFTTNGEQRNVVLKDQVLPQGMFERIQTLQEKLHDAHVDTMYVVVESHNDVRLGINTITGIRVPHAVLRVNLAMSDQEIIETLKITLQHEKFTDRFTTQSDALEYIDVRFDGKILFRFRNGVVPQTVDETDTSS